MGWFTRRPSQKDRTPSNPDLVQAIQRVVANPSQASRQILYQAFLNSNLLLAVQSLPESIAGFPTVVESDTPVSLLTSTDPQGKEVLLAFSDVDSLRARNPSIGWIAMPAKDVLKHALENHFAGIVINPAGSWVELSSEEMKSLATYGN